MQVGPPPDRVPPSFKSASTLLLAIFFELSLAGVALGVGWWLGFNPLQTLPPWGAFQPWIAETGIGVAAAAPLLVGMLLIDQSRHPAMQSLREVVDEAILPLFRGAPTTYLALVSLAAGVGEEVLCRGLIQSGLASWWQTGFGQLMAWIIAAFLFGVAHFVTEAYALIAVAVGLYLGALFWVSDSLWVPIVTHAVYDFAALHYLLRTRGMQKD